MQSSKQHQAPDETFSVESHCSLRMATSTPVSSQSSGDVSIPILESRCSSQMTTSTSVSSQSSCDISTTIIESHCSPQMTTSTPLSGQSSGDISPSILDNCVSPTHHSSISSASDYKNPKYSYLTALNAVKKGISYSAAARVNGVNRITLMRKDKGITAIDCRRGPPSKFSKEEEKRIVKWLIDCGKLGFPVSKSQFIDRVTYYVEEMKEKDPSREFGFTDNIPGRKWLKSFLKRHPEISFRTPQNLTKSRAAVTKEKVQKWHIEVSSYFLTEKLMDILKDARRNMNGDEAAFFLNPKGEAVMVLRGQRNVYALVNINEKECLTVLLTCTAAGDIAPPLVVFPGQRLSKGLAKTVPPNWGIGKSESGWMTSEVFYEYLANVFMPWLVEKEIPRPVVLFVDGHSSHDSLETSLFCEQNGIILVSLCPNSTHILQPMDVAVFHPLKQAWKLEVGNWRRQNFGLELTKFNFSTLLARAIDSAVTPETLKNGFESCGLHPWNFNAIDFSKLPTPVGQLSGPAQDENKDSSNCALSNLEHEIGEQKLKLFLEIEKEPQSFGKIAIHDVSLFQYWKNLRGKLIPETKTKKKKKTKRIPLKSIQLAANETTDIDSPETSATPKDICSQQDNNDEMVESLLKKLPSISDVEKMDKHFSAALDDLVNCEKPNKNDSTDSSAATRSFTEVPSVCCENSEVNLAKVDDPIKPREEKSHSEIEADAPEPASDTAPVKKNTPIKPGDPNAKVPSPFQKSFFYPNPKPNPNKKSRLVEKVPSVVTSQAYQEFIRKKEAKKAQLERLKEENKAKRLAKAAAKAAANEAKKKNPPKKKIAVKRKLEPLYPTEDESAADEPSDVAKDNEAEIEIPLQKKNLAVGSYVIVVYEEEYFPGIVLKIDEKGAEIKVMQMSSEDWKWPAVDDILWYDNCDIIQVIDAPTLKTTRGFYSVPAINTLRKKKQSVE